MEKLVLSIFVSLILTPLLLLFRGALWLFFFVGGPWMILGSMLYAWLGDTLGYPLSLTHIYAICAAIGVLRIYLRLYHYFKWRAIDKRNAKYEEQRLAEQLRQQYENDPEYSSVTFVVKPKK